MSLWKAESLQTIEDPFHQDFPRYSSLLQNKRKIDKISVKPGKALQSSSVQPPKSSESIEWFNQNKSMLSTIQPSPKPKFLQTSNCKTNKKNQKHVSTHAEMLEIDIVSESVRPELKLANSESRRETGL
jgi:hypothetical protein